MTRRRQRAIPRVLMAGLSVLACSSSAAPDTSPAPPRLLTVIERDALRRVSADEMREVTAALTADSLEGRDTGSPGGARAARLLASRMKQIGLQPGADGSFVQHYPVVRASIDSNVSRLDVDSVTLRHGHDFIGADDGMLAPADVRGPLVFVGYGVRDSAAGHDDLANTDVKGKVLVVLARRPPDGGEPPPWAAAVGSREALHALLRAGAIGIVLVDRWDRPFQMMASGSGASVLALRDPSPRGGQPVVRVSERAAERLFSTAGLTLASVHARAATGANVTRQLAAMARLVVHHLSDTLEAANVVGVLPGRDDSPAAEAIVFMAHFDALGRDAHGRIRAGAADNALGVAMLLSVANALARTRPASRRSIVFLATSGEERGMLGATFWVAHQRLALDRIVAAINFDGIGTEVLGPVRRVVGYGAELSTLGEMLAKARRDLDVREESDPFASQRPFQRSDHIVLARHGIPALMLLGLPADSVARSIRRTEAWLRSAYHQAGDTVRVDWDWSGPRDIASLALLTGLRAANAPERAEWYPGGPYARSKAPGPRR